MQAYRHLRMGCWSIRERGRVVGHLPSLVLRDVRFVVSAAGVRRVRLRQSREVVAYARGALPESPVAAGALRVRFCPYRSTDLTLDDGSPIISAAFAHFLPDGTCWAVPHLGDPPCVTPSSPSSSP